MKQRISACVIAKNEAANIGRWLASVQPIADEMIVVDTGSTDGTADIARKGGAKVFSFAWRDDFAAAKNFALAQAAGDWILFLDAAAFFSEASIPRVRPPLARLSRDLRIAGVLCRLVNIDLDDGGRRMTSLVQLRMFRNSRRLRYEGRVHETLTLPQGRRLELAKGIEILHTGYSRSIVKKKMERDLALLERRVAEQGEQPVDARYFMDIYYGLGRYDAAIAYAKKLIAMPDVAEDLLGRAYETWTSSLIRQDAPDEELDACFREARQACPALAEFPLMCGLHRFDRGGWLGAEQDLAQGLALHAQYAERESITAVMDNAAYLLPQAYWRLGILREAHHDFRGAQDAYVAGLSLAKRHEGLLASFCQYLQRMQAAPVDIIALLNALYDEDDPDDMAFLAAHLADVRAGEVGIYYRRRAGIADDPARAYLAAGRMGAAAELAARDLAAVRRLAQRAASRGSKQAASLQQVLE